MAQLVEKILCILEAAASASGTPRLEISISSCGVCDASAREKLMPMLAPAKLGESQLSRYALPQFVFPPLEDAVSSGNAGEVFALVLREMDGHEMEAHALGGEAQTSIEAGTSGNVFHRCEVVEIRPTRLPNVFEEIDFRTMGDARAAGKRAQLRVRQLGKRLAAAKTWSEEGETDACEQRSGL